MYKICRQVHIDVGKTEIWPPQRPDFNPIEHVWDILEAKIEGKKTQKLKELEEMLKEEWVKTSAIEVLNVILSMPQRVAAVVAAKGAYIRSINLEGMILYLVVQSVLMKISC